MNPRQWLENAQIFAVVGCSPNPERPSFQVAQFLLQRGKTVWPVRPGLEKWQDITAFPDLESLPGIPDCVDVFRKSEYCLDIAKSAVRIGAKGVWLQEGVSSPKAESVAKKAGLFYWEDACVKKVLSA